MLNGECRTARVDGVGSEVRRWWGVEGEAQRQECVDVGEGFEYRAGGERRGRDVAAGHGSLCAACREHLDGRVEVGIGYSAKLLIQFQFKGDFKASEPAISRPTRRRSSGANIAHRKYVPRLIHIYPHV